MEKSRFRPETSVGRAMLALARKFESDPFERDIWIRSFKSEAPANKPETWDKKLAKGITFSATPKDPEAIRKSLGIKDHHKVLVIPVLDGSWSIHKDAVGADFSKAALEHHPNDKRVLADARNLPFNTGEFDHVISYELTPLSMGLSDPASILKALKELLRVGKRVHIIQRMHGGQLVWTGPIITRYLRELGIHHKIIDLTEHTTPQYFFYDPRRDRVVSLTIDTSKAQESMDRIEMDVKALERATTHFKQGNISKGVEEIVRNGSVALQRAVFEQYFLRRITPAVARRMKSPLKRH
ncbi:MAG: class I SAM-dependent methyltransferase [Candidatus Diapherotrites archaeon]|nr:class I SAM-dependent methyltransferase [Candidatus Diapherotrites archaeon]